jgi:hypothetical protein
MFAVLQAFARQHPDRLEIQPGFGRWLDGGEWTPARLDGLDADAWLAEADSQAAAFMDRVAPFLLY